MTTTAVLFRAAPKHRSERECLSGDQPAAVAGHGVRPTRHQGRPARLLGAVRAANAQVGPTVLVGGAGTPFLGGTH